MGKASKFKKFLSSCRKTLCLTSFCRGIDGGNIAPKPIKCVTAEATPTVADAVTASTSTIASTSIAPSLSSLKEHLAATKIQCAYRDHVVSSSAKKLSLLNIPPADDQKSNKKLEVDVSWKLYLEPKSRNRIVQQPINSNSQRFSVSYCLIRTPSVDSASSVPVYLNVYDVMPINCCTYWLGLGCHHSGVQVHGVEYAFGEAEPGMSGIFEMKPQQCEGFKFRKAIFIGWTNFGKHLVSKVMDNLTEKYQGDGYSLLMKNCNHFSNDVCIRLTGKPIPSWVNRLARIGSLCSRLILARPKTKKILHHENDMKVLGSSERFTASSNSLPCSSSVSSSNVTIISKSSRWRRSIAQSSPLKWYP